MNIKGLQKLGTIYIQRKGNGYLATVDDCATNKEARYLLKEYRMSDPTAEYYQSSRACQDWRDDIEEAERKRLTFTSMTV